MYFPSKTAWQTIAASEAGFDPDKLAAAIAYAQDEAETPWPEDLSQGLGSGGDESEPPPWNEVIGPTKPRGKPNGLLLRGGKIVAEWGDTERVDMTFSIAKSYLAVLAGVAVAQGLIRSVDDPVREYALDAGYEHPQNQTISWHHLLQQTSEWQGSLWDKPDLIDRNRQVGVNADNSKKGTQRELQAPGHFWEYNDVRVNRLSLSLMQVFRQPLSEVLKTHIMEPIAASTTWQWHGYRNSYFEIDDRVMPSVPGGSHWGGGLWISSRDHARFGLLISRNGRWQEQQLVAKNWIERLTTPCQLNPSYGYLWWLNKGHVYPSAPSTSFFAMGAGSNLIWIDPTLDLVLVARWVDQNRLDALCAKVMAAINES